MLNKIQLIGHVGQDPDFKQTSGDPVANFTFATTERWKNAKGEQQEKTEWHRVVVWGKLADLVKNYVSKGDRLHIEGKVTTRQWEDKDGNKRYTTEIVAREILFLTPKEGRSTPAEPAQKPTVVVDDKFDDMDDDLPF